MSTGAGNTANTGGSGGAGSEGGNSSVGGAGNQGGGSSQGGSEPTAEDCYDGIDNDQNGDIDCQSPDAACKAICADTCAAPKVLSDPSGTVTGDTTEHAQLADGSSCASNIEHGPAHVYEVTVVNDGMLEARLQSDHDLSLSVRTACDDNSNELACSERITGKESPYFEYVKVEAAPGDKRYIVVEGYSLLEYGTYELEVSSRAITCGDAIVDFPEECDDANTMNGDGCDSSCKLEATETEPNNMSTSAQKWLDPWFASISTINDEDWVWFQVGNNYSVRANTFDLGSGGCSLGLMDTELALYDDSPVPVQVAYDDDGGDGHCASLNHRGMSPGTYYLKTSASASPKALPPFSYYLYLEMDECGNNMIGGAEECDDGNILDGDGCSSICETESP